MKPLRYSKKNELRKKAKQDIKNSQIYEISLTINDKKDTAFLLKHTYSLTAVLRRPNKVWQFFFYIVSHSQPHKKRMPIL